MSRPEKAENKNQNRQSGPGLIERVCGLVGGIVESVDNGKQTPLPTLSTRIAFSILPGGLVFGAQLYSLLPIAT